MAPRLGYEYRHSFSIDPEIISLYPGSEKFVFEIRTNFMLRTRTTGDETIGSERYVPKGVMADVDKYALKQKLRPRLEDYWMSEDEIDNLVSGALDFALKHHDRHSQHGSLEAGLVVIELQVCTVQQAGESSKAALDRAIRPEFLVPLCSLGEWYTSNSPAGVSIGSDAVAFLSSMRRARVEEEEDDDDVDELWLRKIGDCTICLEKPKIGSQISFLPSCNHGFHSHCVARWLIKSMTCPLCRAKVEYVFPNSDDDDDDDDLEESLINLLIMNLFNNW